MTYNNNNRSETLQQDYLASRLYICKSFHSLLIMNDHDNVLCENYKYKYISRPKHGIHTCSKI